MRARLLCAVVLLAAALASAACGKEENERPEARGTSAGFTTYEVSRAGISIDVPSTWTTATADEVFDATGTESVEDEDPEVAEILRMLAQPNSPMKFFAFDPDATAGFATNANVILEDVPGGFTREEYFEASLGQIRRLVDPEGLEEERVQLPAGEALHLTYEQTTPGTARTNTTIQYVLFEEGTGYVLTYSVLPDRVDEYSATFERSAQSFQIG
jgi:hypothetical protein